MYNNGQILQGHSHLIRQLQSLRHHSTITSKDSTQNIPHLPTEHKPISSWPSHTSFSIDQLRKSFGFRNIDTILPHIQKTSLPNYSISTKDREKILDLGETATISTSKSNKDSIPLPHSFGDVIHIDILYGTVTAHEGVRYSLFIVDRATRHRFILPMSNLKTDLLTTMNKLRKLFGSTPRRILTDFDHKLMGQSVLDNFTDDDGFCIIESAPPDKQNQNGLSESNWKSILYMARAWLTSNLLPSQYWWWAMKRATEISNYLPIKIDNKYTTPYELVYNNKPDLRFLIPQFSIAYISRYRDGNIERKNTHSQSIRAILVGRDPVSAAYLFYHPGTQKLLLPLTLPLMILFLQDLHFIFNMMAVFTLIAMLILMINFVLQHTNQINKYSLILTLHLYKAPSLLSLHLPSIAYTPYNSKITPFIKFLKITYLPPTLTKPLKITILHFQHFQIGLNTIAKLLFSYMIWKNQ